MGYLTDNFGKTRLGKRFGRRRFFLLIGIPLMMFYPLLWVEGLSFWYYLSTYVVFEIIYTSIMVPYETLATEMTDDFSLRSKLTGYKAIFGKLANFLAAFIPGQFILLYGKDSATPFFLTGPTYGAILIVAISCLWLCSWERERGEEVETSAKKGLLSTLLSLAKDMRSTFYLRVFRKHLGMYLCGFGAEWLFASIFTYFVIFVLQHDPAMVAGLNSLNSILQLISTALFIGLCVKKGFSKPYILALGIVIFAVLLYTSLWFFHLPSGLATVLMFGITVLFGLGTGGVYYIPWTVYTFLADVDEIYTGRRREGIYAGAMTFSGKILRSIVGVLDGGDPELLRFPVKSAQPTGKRGDRYRSGILRRGDRISPGRHRLQQQMKLDRKAHLVVLQEVARIKAGGKISDIAPDVRVIVEDLVGHRYEECWGNSKLFKDAAPAPAQTVVSH